MPETYLFFRRSDIAGRKLPMFHVFAGEKADDLLGMIEWYSQWRCFCFTPVNSFTRFDSKCILELGAYLQKLQQLYAEGRIAEA